MNTGKFGKAALQVGLAAGLVTLLFAAPGRAAQQRGGATAKTTAAGGGAEAAVRAVLDKQVAAWNRGDVEAFMEGYARGESTRFASGANVTRGWQTVLDRYKASYATREKMGTLAFTDLEIKTLSENSVLVFGKWRLDRANDTPNGLFTLLFERTNAGWRITADHTSSA